MFQQIITLENFIDNIPEKDSLNPIFKQQLIKQFISEMVHDWTWGQTVISDSRTYCYNFLLLDNHLKLYNIINSFIRDQNYNIESTIFRIREECQNQGIVLKQHYIEKFICMSCIYGLLDIVPLQRLDVFLDNGQPLVPKKTIQTVYLLENILCSIYKQQPTLQAKDIAVSINIDQGDFWNDFTRYAINNIQEQLKSLDNIYSESMKMNTALDTSLKQIEDMANKAQDSINGFMEEAFKKHVQDFYGKSMEIIGIFIAVFSLIGFNLFGSSSHTAMEILLLNLSCILGIVTMFFLIENIVNKSVKTCHFVITIIALAILIVIIA